MGGGLHPLGWYKSSEVSALVTARSAHAKTVNTWSYISKSLLYWKVVWIYEDES